ncbi:trypsin-like serine peptidase [Edaphovirga cremea]|uniref:trypsin-like serine peptidase n=1 Tax=Edaphovirga cremea TaxID=2267246 RepID=UPI000DEFEABB|nr:serine protease [Edaphovirga cremea]
MRTSFPLIVMSLLWLSVPVAHSDAPDSADSEQLRLFYGHDDRNKVAKSKIWPWQAIGQIETVSGNLCTATLISPHLALTAGHCVLAPPGNIDKAIALRFVSSGGHWRYQITQLETLVDRNLGKKLKADGDGWIVPPKAAAWDFALIRLMQSQPLPIKPLPLWQGSRSQLNAALKKVERRVTQAGYPEDHLDNLYSHQDCLITGWAQDGVLSHQCDTLPGDSGSPLLMKNPDDNSWSLIAVQSSAPGAADRYRADNRALAVTTIKAQLKTLATTTTAR